MLRRTTALLAATIGSLTVAVTKRTYCIILAVSIADALEA